MSNGNISKIQLPDGSVYDIVGKAAAIDSSYDSATKTVTLTVGTLEDADDTEF